jgi:putative ABC transport system permease protein
MTAWGLAWRTVVHNPARMVLAVGGVAVIGALLFNMLLLSRGLLVSFRDLLDTAGYDIRVMANEGSLAHRVPLANATTLAESIRRLPNVQRVGVVRSDTATATVPGLRASRTEVSLVGSSEGAIASAWNIVEGASLPDAPPANEPTPLVVSTNLAAQLHLSPGSRLQIHVALPGAASAVPPLEGRVIGVGAFQFESADEFTVATTLQGFDTAIGAAVADDEADIVLVASNAGTTIDQTMAAIAGLRPGIRVYSNEQVVEQFNAHAFSYFRQISVVLSSMTLAFAFLLVATLLTMSVNQRLGEVAALRALGFPRRRIAADLLCESALLVGMGGLAALPLGAALAAVLDRILRSMPGVPERLHFFVFEPRTVALHAALMAATGIVASLYPIWLAARLPIAETLRREIVS